MTAESVAWNDEKLIFGNSFSTNCVAVPRAPSGTYRTRLEGCQVHKDRKSFDKHISFGGKLRNKKTYRRQELLMQPTVQREAHTKVYCWNLSIVWIISSRTMRKTDAPARHSMRFAKSVKDNGLRN